YIDQGSRPVAAFRLQHIVARGFLRLRCAIVIKRTHSRIAPDNILSAHWRREIVARRATKIDALRLSDRRRTRIAAIVAIGRADQREVVLIGNGEDDAAIPVLEEIGSRPFEFLRYDDVAALDKSNVVHIVLPQRRRKDLIDPGSRGVDEKPRL